MPITSAATLEEIRELESKIEEDLIRRAVIQKIGGVASPDEVAVRDILPATDLGATNQIWEQTMASANAFNTIYTPTAATKKVFAFYGVKNRKSTPNTTAIRFNLGTAKTKDIWQIEEIYTETQTTRGIATKPVVYNKEESINIAMYAIAAASDNVILLGKVAEPKGETVLQ